MSEFFCHRCRRHKPLVLKSDRRFGQNSFMCIPCKERGLKAKSKAMPKARTAQLATNPDEYTAGLLRGLPQ